MLYLNMFPLSDLFENNDNLTLTSVVFESSMKNPDGSTAKIFNFNKCCIWIQNGISLRQLQGAYLTLTSVVFEYGKLKICEKRV